MWKLRVKGKKKKFPWEVVAIGIGTAAAAVGAAIAGKKG